MSAHKTKCRPCNEVLASTANSMHPCLGSTGTGGNLVHSLSREMCEVTHKPEAGVECCMLAKRLGNYLVALIKLPLTGLKEAHRQKEGGSLFESLLPEVWHELQGFESDEADPDGLDVVWQHVLKAADSHCLHGDGSKQLRRPSHHLCRCRNLKVHVPIHCSPQPLR